MSLVAVVIFTLVGVCAALTCVRRAMIGGQMERSFEVLRVRPRFATHRTPWQAAVGMAAPIPNLDPVGNGEPVEGTPLLPQAS